MKRSLRTFVVANVFGVGLLLSFTIGLVLIFSSSSFPAWSPYYGVVIGTSTSVLYLFGLYVGRLEARRDHEADEAERRGNHKALFEASRSISRYAYVGRDEFWKVHKSHVLQLEDALRLNGYDSLDPFGMIKKKEKQGA